MHNEVPHVVAIYTGENTAHDNPEEDESPGHSDDGALHRVMPTNTVTAMVTSEP